MNQTLLTADFICYHMKTDLIALRVDGDTSALIGQLIKYGFAKTKADAVRMIMQSGIGDVRKLVNVREGAEQTLLKWKRQGIPKLPSNLSEKSIQERD